jgi:hypothetical protein
VHLNELLYGGEDVFFDCVLEVLSEFEMQPDVVCSLQTIREIVNAEAILSVG